MHLLIRTGLGLALVAASLGTIVTPSASLAAYAPHALAAYSWKIDVIDSTGNVGIFPSLALEPSSGTPYISYYDNDHGDLKLAFPTTGGDCGPDNDWSCNSASFQNTTDYGLQSSLSFNSAGKWGVAYANTTAGRVDFRGIPSIGAQEMFWAPIEPSGLSIAALPSLRYDSKDAAQLSYGLYDANVGKSYLKYAKAVGLGGTCGEGIWRCENIVEVSGAGFALFNSLSVYKELPFIYYRDVNRHLAVALYPGGNCGPTFNWSCSPIDTSATVNGLISSHISKDGNFLGVAYIAGDTLRLAESVAFGTGNCGGANKDYHCITIDSVGSADSNQWMGVSLGSFNGKPILAYTSHLRGHSILKIAYPQENGNCGPLDKGLKLAWRCEIVDSGANDVGFYPSLQIDDTGKIYIAHYDLTAGDLKYAISIGLNNTVTDTIMGLGISYTPSPSVTIGAPVTFTASITSGTGVSYAWDFGDGTPVGSGNPIVHHYAAIGPFTAIVTATNSVDNAVVAIAITVVDAPAPADRTIYLPTLTR